MAVASAPPAHSGGSFQQLLSFAVLPVAKVLIMCSLGLLMASKYVGILTAENRKILSKLVFTLFLPCLIFTQLGQAASAAKLLSWWFIPANVFLGAFLGCLLGYIVAIIIQPPAKFFNFTVVMIGIGNIGNVPLVLLGAICRDPANPFGSPSVCTEAGVAYISFGQWVGALIVYTFVYDMLAPPAAAKQEAVDFQHIASEHRVSQLPLSQQSSMQRSLSRRSSRQGSLRQASIREEEQTLPDAAAADSFPSSSAAAAAAAAASSSDSGIAAGTSRPLSSDKKDHVEALDTEATTGGVLHSDADMGGGSMGERDVMNQVVEGDRGSREEICAMDVAAEDVGDGHAVLDDGIVGSEGREADEEEEEESEEDEKKQTDSEVGQRLEKFLAEFSLLLEKCRIFDILQPPVVSSMLALLVACVPPLKATFFGQHSPLLFLEDSLNILGGAMIPCIMLVLGGNLVGGPGSSQLGLKTTVAITGTRLLLSPVVGLMVVNVAQNFRFYPPNDPMLTFVLLLQHTMPTSILAGAVCNLRGHAEKEASAILFWEHILAIFTMACWLSLYLGILF